MKHNLADIRINYSQKSLLESDVANSPLEQFKKWLTDAIDAKLPEVNAMTLATAGSDGIPTARIVLLKKILYEGFLFFTNYESLKGKQLAENPHAALLFFWKELERQVRVSGIVSKISQAESEAYFFSRPILSQAGAIASPQSQIIPNRKYLDDSINQIIKEYHTGKKLQKPTHWGGYIVIPNSIEFWQGRPNRLHDRIQYSLQEKNNTWLIKRLAP